GSDSFRVSYHAPRQTNRFRHAEKPFHCWTAGQSCIYFCCVRAVCATGFAKAARSGVPSAKDCEGHFGRRGGRKIWKNSLLACEGIRPVWQEQDLDITLERLSGYF